MFDFLLSVFLRKFHRKSCVIEGNYKPSRRVMSPNYTDRRFFAKTFKKFFKNKTFLSRFNTVIRLETKQQIGEMHCKFDFLQREIGNGSESDAKISSSFRSPACCCWLTTIVSWSARDITGKNLTYQDFNFSIITPWF